MVAAKCCCCGGGDRCDCGAAVGDGGRIRDLTFQTTLGTACTPALFRNDTLAMQCWSDCTSGGKQEVRREIPACNKRDRGCEDDNCAVARCLLDNGDGGVVQGRVVKSQAMRLQQ